MRPACGLGKKWYPQTLRNQQAKDLPLARICDSWMSTAQNEKRALMLTLASNWGQLVCGRLGPLLLPLLGLRGCGPKPSAGPTVGTAFGGDG